jgi:serine phosphatase RsbU (regulator of sigma subunit)
MTDRPGRHRSPKRRRGRLAHLSPLLLTAALGGLALATPQDFAVSRLLPAAPALAASMWSPAATLALGAVILGAVLVLRFAYHLPAVEFTAGSIAAVTAAAAYAAHVRLQREQTLTRVRSVADAAQAVVLRPVPERLGRVGIESLYLAAAEEARIGGDFFEAVDTPAGVRLILGDVRGKGLSAVGAASAVTNSFREAAYDEPDLVRLARRLDTSLSRYTDARPGDDSGEQFATAVLVQISPAADRVELLSCGHPSPLLLTGGEVRVLEPSAASPPLNMAALIGDDYHVDTVPLSPGDQLLLCTDGVTETRDGTGAFFPLLEWARAQRGAATRVPLDTLHQQLLRFSGGGLDDDIAVLVVRCDEAPPAP